MKILPYTVDHVVRDMAKSLAFYRLLGLDIPPELDEESMVEYQASNGFTLTWSLEAMFVQSGGDKWKDLPGRGRVRLSFHCGSPEGVDETYVRMTTAGYVGESAPWDAFWGQRFAQLLDPDGCMIDIFAPLPE